MNSKQRRAKHRKFPCYINLVPKKDEKWAFDFIDRYTMAQAWCIENCTGNWKVGKMNPFIGYKFEFSNSKSASWFALRWG